MYSCSQHAHVNVFATYMRVCAYRSDRQHSLGSLATPRSDPPPCHIECKRVHKSARVRVWGAYVWGVLACALTRRELRPAAIDHTRHLNHCLYAQQMHKRAQVCMCACMGNVCEWGVLACALTRGEVRLAVIDHTRHLNHLRRRVVPCLHAQLQRLALDPCECI